MYITYFHWIPLAYITQSLGFQSQNSRPAVLPDWNGHVCAKFHLCTGSVWCNTLPSNWQFINVVKTAINHPMFDG